MRCALFQDQRGALRLTMVHAWGKRWFWLTCLARDQKELAYRSARYCQLRQEQPVQANTSEARVTPPLPINTETASQETPDDKDPIEITEKKPLEARDTKASEGDNLSGEEVDKW